MEEPGPPDTTDINFGLPTRLFDLIGRITYAAAYLEYLLTNLAILLSISSVPPSDRTTVSAEARIRFAGLPGTALLRHISDTAPAFLAVEDVDSFQDYLNSVRVALEARHEVVHSYWFLFDFADPASASIGGIRYLPSRKRIEDDRTEEFIERTARQFKRDLNHLNSLVATFRYWLAKMNIPTDLRGGRSGFGRAGGQP